MATQVEDPSTSDDDESTEDEITVSGTVRNGDFQGRLFKWTNYLHGWQERYVVLKQGYLNYYKNELDIGLGCRGALSVKQVDVQVDDECPTTTVVDRCALRRVTNSTNVVSIYASVIPYGIYVLAILMIGNDGFKL